MLGIRVSRFCRVKYIKVMHLTPYLVLDDEWVEKSKKKDMFGCVRVHIELMGNNYCTYKRL